MSFWSLQIDQKTNNIFCKELLPLPLKRGQIKKLMWESQNKILQLLSGIKCWFDFFLEARPEFLEKILLVFRKIWRHQMDILKLIDLQAAQTCHSNDVDYILQKMFKSMPTHTMKPWSGNTLWFDKNLFINKS